MGGETDSIALGQLIVEVKAWASQNNADHAEMKAGMRKDKEWAETRFGQLFDKSDNNNIEIATLKADLKNQRDRVQTLELKIDKNEENVTTLTANVKTLMWFNKLILSSFVVQLLLTLLIAALIKVFT